MRSVGEDVEELGASRNFKSLAHSGYDGESWILVDFVDVVLHLFSTEARHYYDLDGLWGDAKRVEWQEKPARET
jgi:ribosome-associated protein